MLVEAMTLDQKIVQLHGAMETIDIYAMTREAAESGADMDQLAAQIRVERHVKAIGELGIPRFRITNARWASAWATVPRALPPLRCR
jgi:beta-glucosidase